MFNFTSMKVRNSKIQTVSENLKGKEAQVDYNATYNSNLNNHVPYNYYYSGFSFFQNFAILTVYCLYIGFGAKNCPLLRGVQLF